MSNKEPQNDEVFTSAFDIFCSTFCGSKILFKTKYLHCPPVSIKNLWDMDKRVSRPADNCMRPERITQAHG